MRIHVAAFLLAAALVPRSASPAEKDWIVRSGFGAPAGISASQDRILVLADEVLVEFAQDGTLLSGTEYEAGNNRIQIERIVGAREGLIACGLHISGDRDDAVVIRVNRDGTVRWARAVEASWMTDMTAAVEAADGDIVMATRLDMAMLLVRFSPSGEMKWSRVLDRTDLNDVRELVATRDGGIMVIGTALERFAALTRIDRNGKVLWDRVLGSADAGYGFSSAVELADGSFIVAGRMRILSANNREGWLMRISPSGSVMWQKTVGGDGEDGLFAITQLGPDEFAAVGGTTSAGAGDADTWIVTLTASGVIASEIAIGNGTNDGPRDTERSFAAASNGHVAFVSPTESEPMIGRIRLASAACDLTRAIRTRQRSSTATHHGEAALVQRAARPIIKAVTVTSKKHRSEVVSVCRWTATAKATVAPRIIAVEPPDEESILANQVATLLIGRKFPDLDRSATAFREARSTFDSGGSKLLAFYQALARHASLSALGDKEHRRLLEQWGRTTHSATSRIALAAHYSAAAERIRGVNFLNSMLDEDLIRYRQLTGRALELLAEAEQVGKCDAPCYHLWIRTAKLGGWSKPLKKLVALDPAYWEAFEDATFYRGENWGGRPGSIDRFVESSARETKAVLGEVLYALHHAGWTFGAIYADGPAPPPPDWARMRTGFKDFQRLHPKSRRNAHLFAAAAYRVMRDRESARSLFKTPMLRWSPGDVWRDREEYERAKAWALREPVEKFAAQLPASAGRSLPPNVPRLVARAQVRSSDGTVERTHAFLVARPSGPIGMTAARNAAGAASWILDRDIPLSRGSVTTKRWAARFTPPPAFATAFHPLKLRSIPLAIGDRLFIVSCLPGEANCVPHVTEARVNGGSIGFGGSTLSAVGSVDWKQLVGAPVLDDEGAVAGMLMPGDGDPTTLALQLVLD